MNDQNSTNPVAPLWATMRGARAGLAFAWAAWIGVAAAAAFGIAPLLGPAGAVVGILTAGWFLARRMSPPLECLRRYHLDDSEVMAIGPWWHVKRITWSQIERVTQERHALVLAGEGRTVALPLRPLLDTAAWGPVLARVVPQLASELWERLEGGVVRLVPHADPPLASLVWWAYAPAAIAAGLVPGWIGIALAVGIAAGERLGAWLAGRANACVLQPAGIDVRGRRGRVFVPWSHALVTPANDGLGVAVPGRDPGFVSTAAPSFWAAAAVIELRAQLGPTYAADVNFRVRFENGGIAVVGEIESLH
ncbi:MAG TPA: hypothetical protein VMS22_13930 [Candidatus Eisenbacteria bacterium]|nr:hypothetical protein [Candidatus Eisenbacteria bacterium]